MVDLSKAVLIPNYLCHVWVSHLPMSFLSFIKLSISYSLIATYFCYYCASLSYCFRLYFLIQSTPTFLCSVHVQTILSEFFCKCLEWSSHVTWNWSLSLLCLNFSDVPLVCTSVPKFSSSSGRGRNLFFSNSSSGQILARFRILAKCSKCRWNRRWWNMSFLNSLKLTSHCCDAFSLSNVYCALSLRYGRIWSSGIILTP